MTFRLGDAVVDPVEFTEYTLERTAERSLFFNSGIVSFNEYAAYASSPGRLTTMPFIKDLSDQESNIDNDDPNDNATPEGGNTVEVTAFLHARNKGIEGMDLTSIKMGKRPITTLADRFIDFWDREYQRFVVQSALGVIADNIANDNGDMVKNVANDVASSVTAAEQLTADTMIDGTQTMGDAKNDLVAIAMHSVVHAGLQKQGAITPLFDPSTGDLQYDTFLGKRVFVSDAMPAVVGANRVSYTSILFAAGAFGHGEGEPDVPIGYERTEASGNGGGKEAVFNRRRFMLHPKGINFVGRKGAGFAGEGPTLAELSSAANWNRAFDRKNVKLAAIISNA